MRKVVEKKENWKDLKKFELPKKEEDRLREETKAQILAGESRILAQDLDSLKG